MELLLTPEPRPELEPVLKEISSSDTLAPTELSIEEGRKMYDEMLVPKGKPIDTESVKDRTIDGLDTVIRHSTSSRYL